MQSNSSTEDSDDSEYGVGTSSEEDSSDENEENSDEDDVTEGTGGQMETEMNLSKLEKMKRVTIKLKATILKILVLKSGVTRTRMHVRGMT
ncbi:hypothetical protein PF005_g22452 [Phytophthora fragariae]|uniref:Uncharacterized protein n=2 Tax=Phytophthora TaxID=4783 RepID=A0A6A3ISF1_9STRA|nr:hypothetical protein PR002_g27288 [Phytophthora rubi]KAE8983698.1 hypothetical protein PF011_g21072 [Phytophthora fragariae]KAE9081893.1 hypothetical protein PF010_g21805 [Phytophthora fragariae]KAE9182519.1 hypothetical protein PF005_g22452 [Phytophthora fragariae]KAE9192884.1 hypothetical protein PF004_g21177 [Phytophthora fragariae]